MSIVLVWHRFNDPDDAEGEPPTPGPVMSLSEIMGEEDGDCWEGAEHCTTEGQGDDAAGAGESKSHTGRAEWKL